MLAYLKRHHIGLLALFIALGGTSYAAVKLPRNSVGTAQLRSAQGIQGPKGDAGPTSAVVTGTNAGVNAGNFTAPVGGTTTITLDRPGKVLVELAGTYTVGAQQKTSGSPASTTTGGDVRVVAIPLSG